MTLFIPKETVWYAYPPPPHHVTGKPYWIAPSPPKIPVPGEAVFWSSDRLAVVEWINKKQLEKEAQQQLELFAEETCPATSTGKSTSRR